MTAESATTKRVRPRRVNRWRAWVQGIMLVGLNLSTGPMAQWQAKWVCLPVMNCHSCALAFFACPVGVFVHYSGYRLFPVLAVGMLLLVGALAGRLFCGWVCPFGTIQDWLFKIRTRKVTLPAWTGSIKYAILFLMVFLFPFLWGELTLASFCRWCAPTLLQVGIPNLVMGVTKAVTPRLVLQLFLLAVTLGACVYVSRFFCRVICPIAAFMAPLNYLAFWRTGPLKGRCVSCSLCDRKCPTDVHPSVRLEQDRPANRHLDCVVCHDCTIGCPVDQRKPAGSGDAASTAS